MYYRYDGTFPGFLSAIYDIYHDGTSHFSGLGRNGLSGNLFAEEKQVETSLSHAAKVADAFISCCGGAPFRWLYRGFLFDDPFRETVLVPYVIFSFRKKKEILHFQSDPLVWQVTDWSHAVGRAAEKMLGLLRFSRLQEGMLYAVMAPDHDVLPLVANHFKKRIPSEAWAIHDLRRKKAAFSDGHLILAEVPHGKDVSYATEEEHYRNLWRGYYKHMAIEERRNPAVRQNFMPKKYWKYLTEMDDLDNQRDIPAAGPAQAEHKTALPRE